MDENRSLHVTTWGRWKKKPMFVFFRDSRLVFKLDALGWEILGIALPAALAVAADPIASLIDTAFIGHIGPVELAAAGVSIALFNQASRITIFPLVSITTSFVAEEDTVGKMSIKAAAEKCSDKNGETEDDMLENMEKGEGGKKGEEDLEKGSPKSSEKKPEKMIPAGQDVEKGAAGTSKKESMPEDVGKGAATKSDAKESTPEEEDEDEDFDTTTSNKDPSDFGLKKNKTKVKTEKRHIASASTALLFGAVLGIIQAVVLVFAARPLLYVMGVKQSSPMLAPALKYLKLRSLGAPAVLLSLAMQGIFRGFKDTKTPLYVILVGYTTNIILDPILIFVLRLGISGAAIAHVLSQYLILSILLWMLMRKVYLLPPSLKQLQLSRFFKNGGLLLARVVAVTFCVTLAASLAARLGATPMAAFQTCLQVWLTSSLLSDGLAVAGQAILACAFAEKDLKKATAIANRVLQMSFVLGVGLALVVGVGLYFGAGIFSRDVHVLHLIKIGLPFVAATQPINSLAFVFDGVNFGASDFAYSAYSLVIVAAASITSLFILYKDNGFVGIWIALTIYMFLRAFAGIWRMGTGTGPWRFLRNGSLP
ncbi:protein DETOXIFICATION 43-like [Corylus avellana]|uniref:protein DETOXIFICATION 43-like n=1 Tax=Corylus avellana TaxID=13451 RepID=UPI00286D24B1|nr:protein DETOXIFICATION 43-like [Corylus avellana]XP_059430557.1 protein DETOXIFICATION 43-like [Corylus avellana]